MFIWTIGPESFDPLLIQFDLDRGILVFARSSWHLPHICEYNYRIILIPAFICQILYYFILLKNIHFLTLYSPHNFD